MCGVPRMNLGFVNSLDEQTQRHPITKFNCWIRFINILICVAVIEKDFMKC